MGKFVALVGVWYNGAMRKMTRLAWLTDIHLNFLNDDAIRQFCQTVLDYKPDAVLIGGDISESWNIIRHLELLADEFKLPICFVLGNHDYYRGSVTGVRAAVKELAGQSEYLNWMPDGGIVELTSTTCLIGHGLWADGRLGDYEQSDVMLNDYIRIKELTGLNKQQRLRQLNQLGDEAAYFLKDILPQALKQYRHVILLAHVPPFKEACWHEGEIADDNWLPHFTCQAAGEVLREIMADHPEHKMTVLCGHTHSSGTAQILPNLQVKTGGAVYGKPEVQEVVEVRSEL